MNTNTLHDWGIPDTMVFDLPRSTAGYGLNKMCNSLIRPENRELYKADETAYIERFALTDEQKQALRARDWRRLVELGGNTYFLMKVGACVGQGLYHIGAQMRGETYEQFLATRKDKGAV
jgi:protocatechuate 4,5-dioxygenase, alpha chain